MNAAEQYATATQSFIKHTHPLHTPQHSAYLTEMNDLFHHSAFGSQSIHHRWHPLQQSTNGILYLYTTTYMLQCVSE